MYDKDMARIACALENLCGLMEEQNGIANASLAILKAQMAGISIPKDDEPEAPIYTGTQSTSNYLRVTVRGRDYGFVDQALTDLFTIKVSPQMGDSDLREVAQQVVNLNDVSKKKGVVVVERWIDGMVQEVKTFNFTEGKVLRYPN